MTNVLKKLAFPVVFCGILCLGTSVEAAGQADIKSIKSDSGMNNTTVVDAGVKIAISVGMIGECWMTNRNPGPYTLPRLQMVVNGKSDDSTWAYMENPPSYYPPLRTYFTFFYTVKPGDMASPLKIFGDTGSSSAGDAYLIDNFGYVFYNKTTTSNLVWRFNTVEDSIPGDVYDLDLTMVAKRKIQTLKFKDTNPGTVPASESVTWYVTSDAPIITTPVSFYVWPANTNFVRVGSTVGQKALLVTMPVGSTSVTFPITGLATGITDIVLQRVNDYNATATVATNALLKQIEVTSPPAPTVSALLAGANSGELDETTIVNTDTLKVFLSQAYAQDVFVRLTTTPSVQTNISFESPVVKVLAGELSVQVPFRLLDGTVTSLSDGLLITPAITNVVASNYYTRVRSATLRVRNVKPVIQQPSSSIPLPTATRGEPYAITYSVSDVPLDKASGMSLTWDFGDGLGTTVTSNATGTVMHTFTTPPTGSATRTVTVTALDKDGTPSDPVTVTVNVIQPVPKPSIRVVPSAYVYSETNTTAYLNLVMSETYGDDVYVLLTTTPAGQTNILLTTEPIIIPSGETNTLAPVQFTIRDGTVASATQGIDIIPTVQTNNAADVNYTSMQKAKIYINNVVPRITKPALASLPSSYANIPMSTPFGMQYTVVDVPADDPTMTVTWEFDNGLTQIVKTGNTLSGWVYPVFDALGDWNVTVTALDKDTGASTAVEFTVTVVEPLPLPTVSILPPAGPLNETTTPSTGSFIVHLSETFTNAVTVRLDVYPTNSLAQGAIKLATNRVVIAKGFQDVTVKFSALDGTDFTRDNGFTITPVVEATASAISHFTERVPGVIELLNVAPVINTPVAMNITGTDVAYTISQGSPWTFYWDVSDVSQDSGTSVAYGMKVTWYYGDGQEATRYGASGSWPHTYTAIGDMVVRVVAQDKDGGRHEVQFKIRVAPAKAVNAAPVGPNVADYYGMRAITGSSPEGGGGIGYGKIRSPEALSFANYNDVYFFRYSPNTISASLIATPYTNGMNVVRYDDNGAAYPGPQGLLFDSFFFVWVGADQGIAPAKLDPNTTTATTIISLPAAQTGTGTTGTTEGVDIRDVQALFSQEWLTADNYGDINSDGIPDVVANWILSQMGAAGGAVTTGDGQSPVWLTSLNTYNGDNDFLPVNPNGIGGTFDFRPVADPNTAADALAVNAFTAIREIRGNHLGLNMPDSDPSYDLTEPVQDPLITDEPLTDPTLADTDGDGFPDGWEFYFWFNARIRLMTGSEFNPANVSVGLPIASRAVELYFEPFTAAAPGDFDKDGLSDVEELTLGTNPINWDTDGDGINDAWEVLRGLNPLTPADAFVATTNNTDGDYMAYDPTAVRALVMVVQENGAVTNKYLASVGDVTVGTNTGSFTTWYHYGNESAPLAVGRPVVLPADAVVSEILIASTNVLLLHYQVLRAHGFDPRTAWTASVNRPPTFNRFPTWLADAPYTRAYTALDEYLLMKFMAANNVNGAGDTMPANAVTWLNFTTDPGTPDTDATLQNQDGMPDGWELYVSIDPLADLTVAANRYMTISPWNPLDGDNDHPAEPLRDGLANRREFAGTDSSALYNDATLYNNTNLVGFISIIRPAADVNWLNKFWPSNPWVVDTDGDGLGDAAETAFMYGTVADNGSTCIQGGGLNPNSVDTDLDALPDAWEVDFSGTLPAAGNTYSGIVITNGMDGTVLDYAQDWDADGLLNHQEYYVQAVRGFRYDFPAGDVEVGPMTGNPGMAMDGTADPSELFTQVTNVWDRARFPWGDPGSPNLWILLRVGPGQQYVSTDPRDPDTDLDSMDDYYEMFHGLNPILGNGILSSGLDDRVGRAYIVNGAWTLDYGTAMIGNDWGAGLDMDFVTYPWLTGMPECDPDADGLRNFEEMLMPNAADPAYYNTDPSPIWQTDSSNRDSLTRRFYRPKLTLFSLPMFFWPGTAGVPVSFSMYTFEMNEGYDTDNDGVCDKTELLQGASGNSDPQDHDDPIRRQAIWFDGVASAAQTVQGFAYDMWAFRSFTVELWARPEVINRDQVLIERPIEYGPSDLSTPETMVRRNFRLGIAADGRVYAMFENAGGHDSHTGVVRAYGRKLLQNEWVHLAASMDGVAGQFTLYVNGQPDAAVGTDLIPANGVLNVSTDPKGESSVVYDAFLVLGAANLNPILSPMEFPSWEYYEQFYQGYMDEVRVWDGARTPASIKADYRKRYTKAELLENRYNVVSQGANGYTSVAGNPDQLEASLTYHYTFDNLFSAKIPSAVTQVPRGFNDPQVSVNRWPDTEVGWWANELYTLNSDVYHDYGYIPWIENGAEHLPIWSSVAVATVGGSNTVVITSHSRNSKYWTSASTGTSPATNDFPNSNDPYGFVYDTALDPSSAGVTIASDLIPMGAAFAKTVAEMWDDQGQSGFWGDSPADSDSDGLPDWWEAYVASIYPGLGNIGWYDFFPDGSGMTMGERYLRDLAGPADPLVGDSDYDGLPDWWEADVALLYPAATNLTWTSAYPDASGVTSGVQYLRDLSDFRAPLVYDTDRDGMPDWWETYAAALNLSATLGWTDPCADASGLTVGQRYLKDVEVFGLTTHEGDVDFNGLPDWWDAQVAALYPAAELGWSAPYPDMGGLTCGEKYVEELTAFGVPLQTGDADQDGLPDWWENYAALLDPTAPHLTWTSAYPDLSGLNVFDRYTLDMDTFTGLNRQINDLDWDGLPNWWEAYNAAVYPGSDLMWQTAYPDASGLTAGDRYQLDLIEVAAPQAADADFDGLPDWFEANAALLDPTETNLTWYATYPDGSGQTAGARYLGVVAAIGHPQSVDADLDGLPNWWEAKVAMVYPGTDLRWSDVYPDGGVVTAGEKYLSYLALAGVPQAGDADFDGLPDGFEWYAASLYDATAATYYPTNTYGWSSPYPVIGSPVTAGEAYLNYLTNDLVTVGLPQVGDADFDGLPDWWEMYVATLYPASVLAWSTPYPDGSGLTSGERYLADLARNANDADNDGLPDWWEMYVAAIYADSTNLGWDDSYPDDSGLTMGERYLAYLEARDLVSVETVQRGDSDFDGMPDWWEQMFGLNPNNASGNDGVEGDPDGDGLTNYYEYLSGSNPFKADSDGDGVTDNNENSDGDFLTNGEEDMLGTHPKLSDTDDDGLNDDVEVMYQWDPVSSASPGRKDRVLALDGLAESYVAVPEDTLGVLTNRLGLEAFTLVARVYPTAAPAVDNPAELVAREVLVGAYNYRLTLDASMLVTITFRAKDNSGDVVLTTPPAFALMMNRWSTVSAVLDTANKTLKLFVEGAEAAELSTVQLAMSHGDYGHNEKSRVGRGFTGYMDDVSVLDNSGTRLAYAFDDETSYDQALGSPAFGSEQPVYALSGQVEDTSAAVNAAAPDWSQANWYNRYRAAGTLLGGADIVFFREDGLGEDEIDSDGDGLPDKWEIDNGFSPSNPDSNGNSIADGLEDTDGDGLNNYYEYLAGLDPRNPATDGVTLDRERDEDDDGLINVLEQAYGTLPNLWDTDDDGLSDYEEIFGTTLGDTTVGLSDPLFSLSPFIPRGLQFDGNGAMSVTNQVRHALTEWTIAAWIKPGALASGAVVARSYSTGTFNYELGVEADGAELRPYAKYSSLAEAGSSVEVKVGHTSTSPGSVLVNGGANHMVRVEQDVWSHVAVVYSPTEHTLSLYVNGDCVAYRTDAIPLPLATDLRFAVEPQLLVGASRQTGEASFLNGFVGMIDDVRIAAYAVNERGVREMMGKQLVIDTRPVVPSNGTAVAKSEKAVAANAAESVPNEFLVGLLPSVNTDAVIAKFKADYQVDTVRKLKIANALHIRVPAGQDVATAKSKIKSDLNVRYIEPNYLLKAFASIAEPNDPRYPELWGMNNSGQAGGVADADIDAPEAWAISKGQPSVVVAVIDTGVDYTHQDLAANMWKNPDEIPANNIDDDGNGFIDDVYGINAITGTGDPMDDHGHGTHCAGTIGAVGDNSEGVAGVNWSVQIMALKFLSAFGGGSTAEAIACIDYAVTKGAKISNNSWGGAAFSQALYDAIARARDKGHLFVAAAGNDSSDNDRTPAYPASYDLDNIISVAATDNRDELAWFSNWGLTTVDIAAPGQDILSAAPGGGYQLMSGTSMAAPHVTGAAALILAVDGSLSYAALAGAITGNGDLVAAADGKTVTGMRLNIGNIITGMDGSAAIRVRALSGWFRFDDGGATMEDFTLSADWKSSWMHAGRLVGSASNGHAAAYLSFGDTDADGLPDWWEEAVGLDPLLAAEADMLPDGERDDDGDGLSNFTEYRATLALMLRGERGLDPLLADTDSDGITDAYEDSDTDGLPNIDEQSVYSTDAGDDDTDDDGKLDGAELMARTRPTDSASPKKEIALTFSGGATENTVVVSDKVNADYTFRHSTPEWTVETWVCPSSGMAAGVYPLVTRKVIEIGLNNYELGLANGYPYVAFNAPDGSRVECIAGSQIPSDDWSHIAGRFELGEVADQNHLSILIDGACVAEVRTGLQVPLGAGDVVLGSAGFAGQMLNTRIWRIVRSDVEIFEMMETELLGGNVGNTSGYLSLSGAGHVKESATTTKANGDTVDMLTEDWSLECWVRTPPGGAGRLIARRNQGSRTDEDFNYCLEVTEKGTVLGRFNMVYGAWTDAGQNFVWVSGEDPAINTIEGELPVNDGEWHHVAYVRDANFCYIYVDGLLDTKQSRMIVPPIDNMIDDPMNFFEVKSLGGPVILGEDLEGALDEVRIWNRALTSPELDVVSRRNLAGDEEGLVSYFNFDLQIGVTADERASIRNPDLEYGIYIPDATRVVAANDGAPIAIDPLRSIQGVALIGLFLGNDGGTTLEDRVYRMGLTPFTADRYAGRLGSGVSFAPLAQEFQSYMTLDSDNDGLPDDWELVNGLDPYSYDTDGDRISDYWDDQDVDGLPNYSEWEAGSDPWNPDSDGDGVLDYDDDSDGDGLSNGQEHRQGSHLGLTDTDDDGLSDLEDGYPSAKGAWATNALLPRIDRYLSLTGASVLQTPEMARWSSGTNSFTLHMEVMPSALPVSGEVAHLAVREVRPGIYNYALQLQSSGQVEALVTVFTGAGVTQQVSVVSAAALTVGEWSALDMVVDLDRQRVLLLVNGVNSGSAFVDLSQLPATSGRSRVATLFGVGFVGGIDNIAFYDEAVSDQNLRLINADDNGLLAYESPALKGCYLFDDGTSAVGVSGQAGHNYGQVQDFACMFWSDASQTSAGFTLRDWLTDWRNAGSLVGAGWTIVAGEMDPDLDGDGMSDEWEMKYGFDPVSDVGVNGAMGDPDGDGLSNYAEYLISEVYKFYPGLNPTLFSTTQTVSDYFLVEGSLYYGEMFSDHDFMEDAWEDLWLPSYISRFVYDPHMDNDQDGWSNWAECRYGASSLRSDPTLGMHIGPDGLSTKDFPVPVIEAQLSYKGTRPVGNLVVFAYSSPEMNGSPDAIFRVAGGGSAAVATVKNLGFWSDQKIRGVLSPGTVVPGTVKLTFTDVAHTTYLTAQAGYDLQDVASGGKTGVFHGFDSEGVDAVIGTVNYVTGDYEIDMGWYSDKSVQNGTVGATGAEVLDPNTSYLTIGYNVTQVTAWPKTLYLTDADLPTAAVPSLGYVKEGMNHFFGMIDLNNNGTWDAGEPCGVSEGFGVDIGWDRNVVKIGMSDVTPGYLRMTLSPAMRSEDEYYGSVAGAGADGTVGAQETRVRVRRQLVDGIGNYQVVVLDKTVQSTRSFIHEGDLLSQGEFALDWGMVGVPTTMNREFVVYDVFLGEMATLTNAVLTFTNRFDLARSKAVSTYPINGGFVYSARPTFKWTMPDSATNSYTAFALEIRSGSQTGPIVYQSGEVQMPVRDINGNFVWTAPIYAGDKVASGLTLGRVFASNTVYAWRVIALNSKFTLDSCVTDSSWSAWKKFRLDVNAPMESSGYGAIQALVKYTGPAVNYLTSCVKVQAFRNSAFAGQPEAEYTLTDTDLATLTTPGMTNVNAVVYGLARSSLAGNYYLRAFIDHNMNGVRDVWESWGYANYYGLGTPHPYDAWPIGVEYSALITPVTINIEDADSDQDWFPDAWEFEQNPTDDFLDLTGPSVAADPDPEVNPYLSILADLGRPRPMPFFTALALTTSDQDGDGLGDLYELVLGTDAQNASTAGDGFTDGAKLGLGLSPYDTLTFDVTGLGLGGAGDATLQWNLAVQKAAAASRALQSLTPEVSLQYEVQYSPSLSEPSWSKVDEGPVDLDRVQNSSAISKNLINPVQGFFRVQLKKNP